MLQRGLTVLVLPVATRILEPAEVGVASAALAVGGFLTMVLAMGFSFAVARVWYDEPPEAERTTWAMLVRVQLGLAAALAGVAWLAGPWWSAMYEDVAWSGALQAAVVLALAQSSQSTALGVLRAARRVHAFLAVVAVHVGAGGTLAIVLAERHGPGGLVAGLAAGATAGALLAAVLTYRRPAWSGAALRAGVALALPFLAHMISGWVLSLSDRVLIERFLDLEDLAAYHVAYALGSLPLLLTDSVQAAWVPRYYGLDPETKAALPPRLLREAPPLVAAVAGAVVLAAPLGAWALAPPGFDVPMTVVALVVATLVTRASYLVGFAVLSERKRSGRLARASATGAGVNVALNLVLIPAWGLTGAAASTLTAYALMSILVVRDTEAALGRGLHLGPMVAGWAATAGALLGAAHLPTDGFGWVVRSAAVLGLAVWGWARTRSRLEEDAFAALRQRG
jgi:O-antigen/teichoic acid export membrane protein